MTTEEHDDREFQAELNAHGGQLRVQVLYVNTGEKTDFGMPRTATLKAVFDEAYKRLKESPRAGDKYFCEGGLDLAPHLALTLEELHRRKICRKRHYEIAGETGGARASAGFRQPADVVKTEDSHGRGR